MTRNKIRNFTGGLSEMQAKIVMVRGFTEEGTLLYQKDFVITLKRPLTTINYNIKILRKKGLLTITNFLTPDGKIVFQKIKGYVDNTKKLRAHKIFGKFTLAEEFKDFEKVRNKFTKISNSPKHTGFRLDFQECVILFYSPKKIFFYLPDIFANSIEEIYVNAYDRYIKTLKKYLEQMFPTLRIDKYEICNITINHVAFQHHPLAEVFKKFNVRYTSDKLEVDHSHDVPELETVDKKTAVEDMDKIIDYEKIIRG